MIDVIEILDEENEVERVEEVVIGEECPVEGENDGDGVVSVDSEIIDVEMLEESEIIDVEMLEESESDEDYLVENVIYNDDEGEADEEEGDGAEGGAENEEEDEGEDGAENVEGGVEDEEENEDAYVIIQDLATRHPLNCQPPPNDYSIDEAVGTLAHNILHNPDFEICELNDISADLHESRTLTVSDFTQFLHDQQNPGPPQHSQPPVEYTRPLASSTPLHILGFETLELPFMSPNPPTPHPPTDLQ